MAPPRRKKQPRAPVVDDPEATKITSLQELTGASAHQCSLALSSEGDINAAAMWLLNLQSAEHTAAIEGASDRPRSPKVARDRGAGRHPQPRSGRESSAHLCPPHAAAGAVAAPAAEAPSAWHTCKNCTKAFHPKDVASYDRHIGRCQATAPTAEGTREAAPRAAAPGPSTPRLHAPADTPAPSTPPSAVLHAPPSTPPTFTKPAAAFTPNACTTPARMQTAEPLTMTPSSPAVPSPPTTGPLPACLPAVMVMAPLLSAPPLPGFCPPLPDATRVTSAQMASMALIVLRSLEAADQPQALRAALVEACTPALVTDPRIATALPAAWERLKRLDAAHAAARADAEAAAATAAREAQEAAAAAVVAAVATARGVAAAVATRASTADYRTRALVGAPPLLVQTSPSTEDDDFEDGLDSAASRAPTAVGTRRGDQGSAWVPTAPAERSPSAHRTCRQSRRHGKGPMVAVAVARAPTAFSMS